MDYEYVKQRVAFSQNLAQYGNVKRAFDWRLEETVVEVYAAGLYFETEPIQ